MTRLQKTLLKMSEHRQAINTLLDAENRTDEQQADLEKRTGEIQGLEPELRASLAAEPPTGETLTAPMDTEDRERLEIRNRTGFRDYLIAALSGSPVSGAAAEFNASCHVSSGDHVPRELFDAPAREMRQRLEHRAVTPGPAIDAAAQPTVPFLFEASVLPTLLVEFPSVQSGVQQIPAISQAPPAGVVAKDADAASTAAAYTLVNRSPKRLAGAVEFRVEDLAVHSTLESDLSSALQESLSNQLDEQGFNGGGGTALSGLFHQATNVSASGTTDTFTLGLEAFASLVDGRYARGMNHLRGVIGSKTFAAYMALYHGGSGDMTLYEKLRGLMGSLEVSDRMPGVSSGAQKGIVTKNAGMQPIRIYTWDSLSLLRDPFTAAKAGKVTVTATQLVSDPFIPFGLNQAVEVNRDLS